ncbi:hypothetical protein BDP27DRAFT_1356929 [Rhodocollybia butyracea]|uniref:Uncharacterized protein n=1 Tax=Rhodocollybia butyracea TaxID=206335 RepID=A0A9P5QBF7_9AGAR|nr:hypothetical protein BDP27DRAFT_1356929 [Rhodocollybia butyracea]
MKWLKNAYGPDLGCITSGLVVRDFRAGNLKNGNTGVTTKSSVFKRRTVNVSRRWCAISEISNAMRLVLRATTRLLMPASSTQPTRSCNNLNPIFKGAISDMSGNEEKVVSNLWRFPGHVFKKLKLRQWGCWLINIDKGPHVNSADGILASITSIVMEVVILNEILAHICGKESPILRQHEQTLLRYGPYSV